MAKPPILTETIHYNPVGAKDALDKIRAFAVTLGWTVDYWSTTDGGGSDYYLQLWSNGYANQNICYRFYVTNVDAQEDTMTLVAVVPGERFNQTNKMTSASTIWGGASTSYRNVSLPAASFAGLYLYGNGSFIAINYNVSATMVIGVNIGTIQLFSDWWTYVNGLFLIQSTQFWAASGANYRWYNAPSYASNWYPPVSRRTSSSSSNLIWYEGAARDSTDYAINYRPNSTQDPDDIGVGEFNKARYFLKYNSYTTKRVGFAPTHFVRDPSVGVWYPLGTNPMIWLNGRDLTIGEEVEFGTDVYRCFPAVFSNYDLWRAYRTA